MADSFVFVLFLRTKGTSKRLYLWRRKLLGERRSAWLLRCGLRDFNLYSGIRVFWNLAGGLGRRRNDGGIGQVGGGHHASVACGVRNGRGLRVILWGGWGGVVDGPRHEGHLYPHTTPSASELVAVVEPSPCSLGRWSDGEHGSSFGSLGNHKLWCQTSSRLSDYTSKRTEQREWWRCRWGRGCRPVQGVDKRERDIQ